MDKKRNFVVSVDLEEEEMIKKCGIFYRSENGFVDKRLPDDEEERISIIDEVTNTYGYFLLYRYVSQFCLYEYTPYTTNGRERRNKSGRLCRDKDMDLLLDEFFNRYENICFEPDVGVRAV